MTAPFVHWEEGMVTVAQGAQDIFSPDKEMLISMSLGEEKCQCSAGQGFLEKNYNGFLPVGRLPSLQQCLLSLSINL